MTEEHFGWSSVPNWVIRSNTLQGVEKLLFIALLNRANSKGECWPSLATLANDSGVTKKTVLRKIASLQEKGLILRIKRKGSDGRDLSNVYRVLAFREGVESTPQGVNETQGGVESLHSPGVNEHHEVLPIEVLPSRSTTHSSENELEELFSTAYARWPKKEKRKDSFAKFKIACRKRDPHELVEDIIRFGDAYSDAGIQKQYVPALVYWLNGERWNDALPQRDRQQRGMSASEKAMAIAEGMNFGGRELTT